LELFGFVQSRQRGSHIILKKITAGGRIGTLIPDHKELAEDIIRGLLKQVKISMDEFLEPYNR